MMPHCILNRDICIAMSHSKYIKFKHRNGRRHHKICIHVFTHFFTVSTPDRDPDRDRAKSEFMNRDIDRFFNCCNIYEINV